MAPHGLTPSTTTTGLPVAAALLMGRRARKSVESDGCRRPEPHRLTTAATLLAISIALYAASFPPWEVSAACWLALVPLLLVIRRLTPGVAVGVGLLWGVGSNFAVGYWVPGAIRFYYEQPLWFGWVFCLLTSLVFWAPYYAVFAALAAWTRPRLGSTAWGLLVAALWVVAEIGRANLLTGAPWLMLGYALVPHPWLRQAADIGGVYVLSFVVVLVNAALAQRLAGAGQGTLGLVACVLAVMCGYGAWRVGEGLPSRPAVRVAVIQGNNQDGAQWIPGSYAKGLDDYLRLSAEAMQQSHPQILVWPEAAVTMFFAHEPRAQARIADLLHATDAELILGAPHYEIDDPALPQFLNSAFAFRGDGQIGGRYDKRHLMPFTEYFPLRTIELLRRRFERVRTFVPGTEPTLLETRLGKTAVAICFEAIFPDLVRRTMGQGAEVLVNLSNDIWLGQGGGPEQHIPMIRLRAVENHTWVIRSTTTGVSAIIDPFGNVVASSRTFEPAVLNAAIVPLHVSTFYQRYGDIFAYACLVLSLLLILRVLSR